MDFQGYLPCLLKCIAPDGLIFIKYYIRTLMSDNGLSLFKAFYQSIPGLTEDDLEQYTTYSAALQSEVKDLNPVAANNLVQDKLNALKPDAELLNLYDSIRDFQFSAMGESYEFEEGHDFVSDTAAIAKRLTGKPDSGMEALPALIAQLKEALLVRLKIGILKNYLDKNASSLHEYRLKQLEQGILNNAHTDEPKSLSEFTHTQQAIAIHYLFHEALGITGIDTTRLMEFAHLLSAKKIPRNKETWKENIRNSGIKSAFNKAWKKEDANHLADLRFVLRFFKPLDVVGATGIGNAVTALEKRIARISEKLNKAKD